MTVFLFNNYSMRRAHRSFLNGEYPAQHLWGYPVRGARRDHWTISPSMYDFRIRGHGVLAKVRSLLLRTMGDPIQCVMAMRAGKGDVVFSADQWSLKAYLLMPKAWRRGARTVVLVHHKTRNPLDVLSIKRADAVGVLSPPVGAWLGQHAVGSVILPWGPDCDSPLYRCGPGEMRDLDFVAAGRTNRDYGSLRAAALRGLRGVIFDGRGTWEYRDGQESYSAGSSDYPEILATMSRARCIAVPLKDLSKFSGLTEIADALALSIPILIDRVDWLPFDIEDVGVPVDFRTDDVDLIYRAVLSCTSFPHEKLARLVSLRNLEAYNVAVDRLLTPDETE